VGKILSDKTNGSPRRASEIGGLRFPRIRDGGVFCLVPGESPDTLRTTQCFEFASAFLGSFAMQGWSLFEVRLSQIIESPHARQLPREVIFRGRRVPLPPDVLMGLKMFFFSTESRENIYNHLTVHQLFME
jgi:hypothetical protein